MDRLQEAVGGLAELLIDCEEDRTLRAVLVGMLREADRTELISDLEDKGSASARRTVSRRSRRDA